MPKRFRPDIHNTFRIRSGTKLCVELSEDGADKPLQTKLCKTNADGVAAVDFVIENPKLWWPNDYGDQPLYIVRTTLLDEDGTSLESITRRIGLRTLTISQEKTNGEMNSPSVSMVSKFYPRGKLYSG